MDLTGIAVALIGGIFSVLGIVITYQISARMADKQAAAVLSAAVTNSLGAMEQAADGAVVNLAPHVTLPLPGCPPALQPATQYVLDHAGTEAARLGVTPAAIADKINARIGLEARATRAAVAVAAAAPQPAAA